MPSSFSLGLIQAENVGRIRGVIREKLVRLAPGSRDSVCGKLFHKNFTQVSGDGANLLRGFTHSSGNNSSLSHWKANFSVVI